MTYILSAFNTWSIKFKLKLSGGGKTHQFLPQQFQENEIPLQVQTAYPNNCKKMMTHYRCNVYSTSPQLTSRDSDTVLDKGDLPAPANESRFHAIPHAY
jgi:hypothetical protein